MGGGRRRSRRLLFCLFCPVVWGGVRIGFRVRHRGGEFESVRVRVRVGGEGTEIRVRVELD